MKHPLLDTFDIPRVTIHSAQWACDPQTHYVGLDTTVFEYSVGDTPSIYPHRKDCRVQRHFVFGVDHTGNNVVERAIKQLREAGESIHKLVLSHIARYTFNVVDTYCQILIGINEERLSELVVRLNEAEDLYKQLVAQAGKTLEVMDSVITLTTMFRKLAQHLHITVGRAVE